MREWREGKEGREGAPAMALLPKRATYAQKVEALGKACRDAIKAMEGTNA